MSLTQQIITVGLAVLATMLTRFIPFWVFRPGKPTPKYIVYLGKVLPASVFALLVVYSVKDVDFSSGVYGLPELIGILITLGIHLWRKNMLLSIGLGTLSYMLIVQNI